MLLYSERLLSWDACEKEVEEAKEWRNKALRSNDCTTLGYCYASNGDKSKCFAFFEKPAKEGE